MADAAVTALNSLLRNSSIDDHDEVLKLSNAAIKASIAGGGADLLKAQHTKTVALLKLDRFDDALRTIADGGSQLEAQCLLEKAYALYKTGDLDAAAEICADKSDRGLRHVAAQVAYRLERFDPAADTYKQLLGEKDGNLGEDHDIRVNLLATNAQLEWSGRGALIVEKDRQASREDLEIFETAYNAACMCIGKGDLAKATILLKRARDLCEASEDLSDDEKKAEILPIIVQQAYAFSRLGKLDEAAALQRSVQISEISDESTTAVAQNNNLTGDLDKNPYLAQRLWQESVPTPTGNNRLFEYQANILNRNRYIIELQCQKFPGVARSTVKKLDRQDNALAKTSPEAVNLGILHAAATARLKTDKDALKTILAKFESRPYDVGLLLTIIHLYLQLKNPVPAITLLEAFLKRLEAASETDHSDVRFAPGLVALTVALYKLQGRAHAARSELAKAAAHWQKGSEQDSPSLLREAGIELLYSPILSDHATAGAAFERLSAANPKDKLSHAGLVASFASTDFDKVKTHLSSLTPVDQLIKGVDVSKLLSKGVATLTQPAAAGAQESKKRSADSGARAEHPRKRRRQKLPKDYDPNRKMDPERWLPLRDRSSYRPKGRKGKKRAAEATQGGVVKEEETLELAGGAGSVRVEKAPQGGGGGGKKKKKGKK